MNNAKAQNKWEEMFDEWLDLTEFSLVKHKTNYNPTSGDYGHWSLIDHQGANLGDIEDDRFDDAAGVLERMSGCYLDDYILNALCGEFPDAPVNDWNKISAFGPTILESWLDYARKNPKVYEKAHGDFDILDMFANHADEINLENCCYQEEDEERGNDNYMNTNNNTSENYKAYKSIIESITPSDIVGILDLCNEMKAIIDRSGQQDWATPNLTNTFNDKMHFIRKTASDLMTNKICPRCHNILFKSDLPQYDYVCIDCNENFYECEITNDKKIKKEK